MRALTDPRCVRRIGGTLWDGIPRPAKRPGARVECTHLAARGVDSVVVGDGRSKDDESADDGGWRCDLILGSLERRIPEANSQVDRPVRSEIGARPAIARVKRDETRVDHRNENAAATARVWPGRRVDPGGDATIREVAEVDVAVEARVEDPSLGSGRRIERDDAAERGGEVHGAVDDKRSGLERRLTVRRERGIGLSRSIRPGDAKPSDVVAGDVVDRRITTAARIAPVGAPLDRAVAQARRWKRRRWVTCEQQKGSEERATRSEEFD